MVVILDNYVKNELVMQNNDYMLLSYICSFRGKKTPNITEAEHLQKVDLPKLFFRGAVRRLIQKGIITKTIDYSGNITLQKAK